MTSVNLVYLAGRLGRDPEIFSFQNGGIVVRLSMATSERWTDKRTGERREHTEWHTIICHERRAIWAFRELKKDQ